MPNVEVSIKSTHMGVKKYVCGCVHWSSGIFYPSEVQPYYKEVH
jgi:hypothetical protein